MSLEETELVLEFPLDNPLKKDDRTKLTNELLSSLQEHGITARVKDYHYTSKRAFPEVVALALVLGMVADIVTIAIALREFLRRRKDIQEFRLRTKSMQLVVKGDMSDKTIIELVKEGKKIVDKQEQD
jgi:hypothetical protein